MGFFNELKSTVSNAYTLIAKERKTIAINDRTKVILTSDKKIFLRILSGDAVIFHRVYSSEIDMYLKTLENFRSEIEPNDLIEDGNI